MRLDYVIDLGFNYKHFLHTHSHIAFLGWMYNALVIGLEFYFFRNQKTSFNRIFWVTQITILGMLLSFPFQGYAFWSICFSTLYLFASYWLIFEIFKQSKLLDFIVSKTLLKAAGIFLFFSSIGPFGLAIVMANHLEHTVWNSLSVYWFLHYLFNGFFFLLILSILLAEFKKNVEVSSIRLTAISHTFIFSIIPLYFNFILEFFNTYLFVWVSIIGSLFQLLGLLLMFKPMIRYIKLVTPFFNKFILTLFFSGLILKIVFQVISNIDAVQTFIRLSKTTVIIGFIHLVMLGVLSVFLFWFFIQFKLIKVCNTTKAGLFLFFSGIFLSELLLFGQSLFIYFNKSSISNYYQLLFYSSLLIPLGIFLIVLKVFKK